MRRSPAGRGRKGQPAGNGTSASASSAASAPSSSGVPPSPSASSPPSASSWTFGEADNDGDGEQLHSSGNGVIDLGDGDEDADQNDGEVGGKVGNVEGGGGQLEGEKLEEPHLSGEEVRATEQIAEGLIEELIFEVALEMHRNLRLGRLCLNCDSLSCEVVQRRGSDIFGQSVTGRSATGQGGGASNIDNVRFDCPNCAYSVVASRYAPHLEKCMGIARTTRNSSRLASHRLSAYRAANSNAKAKRHIQSHDDDGDYEESPQRSSQSSPSSSAAYESSAASPSSDTASGDTAQENTNTGDAPRRKRVRTPSKRGKRQDLANETLEGA